MSVYKFSAPGTLKTGRTLYTSMLAGNATYDPYYTAYDFIAAASPTGTTVTFSSIPQTYKHLRLHIVGRSTYTAYDQSGFLRFNTDTGTNYRRRYTLSNGSTPLYPQSGAANWTHSLIDYPGSYITANRFASGVVEIFDYTSTTKIKNVQSYGGYVVGGYGLGGGYWNSTSAITSMTIDIANGNFVTGSHFALYGVKG